MWIMRRQKALLLSCFVLVAADFESDADLTSTGLHRTKRSEVPCAAKFRLVENHSACLPRSQNNPGVSEADKKFIVDTHNVNRSSADPPATNMLRMTLTRSRRENSSASSPEVYTRFRHDCLLLLVQSVQSWDDEVAMIAQKWADNCDLRHDSQRNIPGRFSVGQNIAMGAKDWSQAIALWYSEVKDFDYGNKQKMIDLFLNIGHYTQMMWAETSKIGCGFSVCKGSNFHVCNYAPSGNVNSNYHLPYKSGPSCSECQQDKCSNKLCDCGFTCLNGASMNTSDCTCTCLNDFFLQPDCRLKCKEQDQELCSPGKAYFTYKCDVVRNHCPVRCQLCPYAEDGYSDPPPGTAQINTISMLLLVSVITGSIVCNFL